MTIQLLKSLLFKSARVQREIENEQRQKSPDRFKLLRLKKIRLAIKDRLNRMLKFEKKQRQFLKPSYVQYKSRDND